MITIPIYDYRCKDCTFEFENIEVASHHKATSCKACGSPNIERIIGLGIIRMDSDMVKHNLPDPVPPLRELVGKNKPGTEGGYKELANDKKELKEYKRTKDKYGNSVWLPKERKYFTNSSKRG